MSERDGGAVFAGIVLVAMPLLDLLFGGEGAVAVRILVGACGLGLIGAGAIRPRAAGPASLYSDARQEASN